MITFKKTIILVLGIILSGNINFAQNTGSRLANLPAKEGTDATSTLGANLTSEVASGSFSLTDEGPLDWIKWGRSGLSVDRKSIDGSQISNWTVIESGIEPAKPTHFDSGSVIHTWSDGTPTARASSDGFVRIGGIGNGFEFTVSADERERTLIVDVVLQYRAEGQLELSFENDVVPAQYWDFFAESDIDNHRLFITYSSTSSTTLRVKWMNNITTGNVGLRAAALR